MRGRGYSFSGLGTNISEKHLYDQLAAALDTDLRVNTVKVGVDGVGRDTQLAPDRRLVQPVKYASDDL